MTPISGLVFMLLLFLGRSGVAQATHYLKQVHVVNRHGSGYFFDDGNPDANSILTLYGQEQVYELGRWLYDQYYDTVLATYDPSKVFLSSSATDRTIVSAQILAQAIFADTNTSSSTLSSALPAAVNIPVYTTEDENDYTIRAYDKCPQGINLDKLYRSSEWTNLQDDHLELLQTLATFPQFQDYTISAGESFTTDDSQKNVTHDTTIAYVPLEDVFNVFDAILVAKQECDHINGTLDPNTNASTVCPTPVHDVATILSDSDWKSLQKVTHAAELTKYDTDTSGRLASGNLWLQILNRAKRISSQHDGSDGFYLYSGHYATLLGMFAAVSQDPPTDTIPNYASAVIVEVYYDSDIDSTVVKVLYKEGGSAQDATTVKLMKCGSDTYCNRNTLYDLFSDLSMRKWCHECGNDSANACLQALLDQADSTTSDASSDKCNSTTSDVLRTSDNVAPATTMSNTSPGVIVGSIVIGMILGIILMLGSWYFCCGRRHNQRNSQKNLDVSNDLAKTINSSATISPTSSEENEDDLTEIPINGPHVYA